MKNDTKKEWTVIDGKENKCSTNGTWIFGTHSFLIKKEMMVEILNSKIIIKEINNDKNNENDEIIWKNKNFLKDMIFYFILNIFI